MMNARISFLELPADNLQDTTAFYESVFGWQFSDFGPTYRSSVALDVNIGFQGDASEASSAPLNVIEVDNLEAAHRKVMAAGATITRQIFSFPGGRRFHFRDPSGNELAVMQHAA